MKRAIGFLVVVFAVTQFGFPGSTLAQTAQGHVVIPQSNNHTAADAGVTAHTNYRIFVPDMPLTPEETPPVAGYYFETPASLACIYGPVTPVSGCNPNTTDTNTTGGSRTIAIVDAYDYPQAASDLAVFSAQFGLPAPTNSNFEVVYANGRKPPEDATGGWEGEEALDIEQAHALAPGAKIYLVEADSNSDTDLFNAVKVATNLVICGETTCRHGGDGKGEISMGWGGSEWSGEWRYDSYFVNSGVVYFAAAGDEPGVEYPCTSPNVVCVGGTSTARNLSTGNFLYEVAWMDASGGTSAYESRPSYQWSIRSIVGSARGVPDISFDGNPNTGVWNYDSFPYEYAPGEYVTGWGVFGGTSVGSPSIAGIVNSAGNFSEFSTSELQNIYNNSGNAADYTDTTKGYCGPYVAFTTLTGWDFCTGVGSPFGYGGK